MLVAHTIFCAICCDSDSGKVCVKQMLFITNHPHNKVHRASPRRNYPLRGCSDQTVDRIFANEDAMQRLLSEFDTLDDVSSLRKCNKQVCFLYTHKHSMHT